MGANLRELGQVAFEDYKKFMGHCHPVLMSKSFKGTFISGYAKGYLEGYAAALERIGIIPKEDRHV